MRISPPPLVWAAGLTALAGLLRLVGLETLPEGLHGDEAWTGIDARRILEEGWIGVYLPSALGQPAGPMYWTAGAFALFGDSTFVLRASIAALGVLTIPAAYAVFGRTAGPVAACLGAFFLATSLWHVHFSRIAFGVVAWPLVSLAAAGALHGAIRRDSAAAFGAAGLVLGLGLFVYNAHVTVAVALGLVALSTAPYRFPPYALGAAVASYPVWSHGVSGGSSFWNHFEIVLSWPGLADLPERARLLGRSFFFPGTPSWADGFGTGAAFGPLLGVLLVAGIVLAARDPRRFDHRACLIVVAVVIAGALATDGSTCRRSFAAAPFATHLAALPLAALWRRGRVRTTVGVAIVVGTFETLRYFTVFPGSDLERFVFAREIASASRHLASLPGDPQALFFSSRWSYDYETRRFLAPRVSGEDRSREFGRFDLEPPPGAHPVYVLLPPYFHVLPKLIERWPGGRTHDGRDSEGRRLFLAFHPDPETAP